MKLRGGGVVEYDWLVLAMGSSTTFFDIPGVRELTFPFCDYKDAMRVTTLPLWPPPFSLSSWSQRVLPLMCFVADSLLCACTVEAVSGIGGLAEAEGQGSIRGCLRSREWLCRIGYLVHSAGCIICTGNFAQYGYLLHSRVKQRVLLVQLPS